MHRFSRDIRSYLAKKPIIVDLTSSIKYFFLTKPERKCGENVEKKKLKLAL
jgi:hypothetical protein